MTEWSVQVNGVGVIGTVDVIDGIYKNDEARARLAAFIHFSQDGPRCVTGALPLPYIYEDDDFAVTKLS